MFFLGLGVVGLIFLVVALGVVLYFITVYNGLISCKHDVDKAWANIDVLLKQRHDELPKLMSTLESYMQYEQETLHQVMEARTRYQNTNDVNEKVRATQALEAGLGRLFAVAENYPDLKANQQFQDFQRRISELENAIADRREFFNSSVNIWNVRIEQLPDLFIARLINAKSRELLKVADEEKKDVNVQLKMPKR